MPRHKLPSHTGPKRSRPAARGLLRRHTTGSLVADVKRFQKSWPARAGGRVCPYLSCPADGCGSAVIWPDASIANAVEELRCIRCSWTVGEDRLALTRDSMQSRPPDILFTTTEMLNRSSSNRRTGKLFGWNPTVPWRPRLLLLDEVHTYEGVHGAQVALLVRRWRNAVGPRVTVVGLSATLRDAGPFMSRLVGIPDADVTHVEPAEDDLIEEGRQYQIAVRADPTPVRACSPSPSRRPCCWALLGPARAGITLAGSKGFLFTDDLDVTNRLFHDLKDAEGRRMDRPTTVRRLTRFWPTCARPRCSGPGPPRQRTVRCGPSSSNRPSAALALYPARCLEIGRKTRPGPGVADSADVVVATASLDVGFNDPRVGLSCNTNRRATGPVPSTPRPGRSIASGPPTDHRRC